MALKIQFFDLLLLDDPAQGGHCAGGELEHAAGVDDLQLAGLAGDPGQHRRVDPVAEQLVGGVVADIVAKSTAAPGAGAAFEQHQLAGVMAGDDAVALQLCGLI